MAGSIRQLPSGAWHLRVSAGTDDTGRRRVITETMRGSRRSAELRLAELVSKARRGEAPTGTTLRDAIDAWAELPRLSAATRAKVRTVLGHLPPALGRRPVDQITGRDLDHLYQRLLDAGVGAPTVRNLHGVIRSACSQAVKWGTVVANPAQRATPPPDTASRALGYVTDDQIAALVAAVAHDQQQTLWLRLHLVTGARRSELLALRWSSIDGQRLHILTALEKGGKVKGTKTNVVRTISIDADTSRMVRDWQHAVKVRAVKMGASLVADPYLLTHDDAAARPWRPDGATQLFRRVCERAGVEGVRLHDLRHAAASYLLGNGMDVVAVAARLGHATPRTTLNIYGHVLEGRDSAAADLLAARPGVG